MDFLNDFMPKQPTKIVEYELKISEIIAKFRLKGSKNSIKYDKKAGILSIKMKE